MTSFADMFLGNWFPKQMLEASPPIVATFRQMILSTPTHGLAGNFAAIRDMDLRRPIALIPRPTLVIGGQYDTVTLASHSESIAATIPGAKLVMLPAVHMPGIEFPQQYLRAVLDFLLQPS